MVLMTGIGTADNPGVTASIAGLEAAVQLSPAPSAPGWIQAKVPIPVGLNSDPELDVADSPSLPRAIT